MPAVSKAQQRLMAAAEHGADFPEAKKLRKSMSHEQLHDFAVGSMADKPEHAGPTTLAGDSPDIMDSNTKSYRNSGMDERSATIASIKKAKRKSPNAHKNLGNFLHPRKDGKPHGSID